MPTYRPTAAEMKRIQYLLRCALDDMKHCTDLNARAHSPALFGLKENGPELPYTDGERALSEKGVTGPEFRAAMRLWLQTWIEGPVQRAQDIVNGNGKPLDRSW